MTECSMPNHAAQTYAAALRDQAAGVPAYYVARCVHFGGRGVVEIRNIDGTSAFVDYVQWEPRFLCEAYTFFFDREGVEAAMQRLWDRLNQKMLAGDPPDEDR